MIITIDGFAGTGKSSTAREVAKKLSGFHYLDTGATYRCVALYFKNQNIDTSDYKNLDEIFKNIKIDFDLTKTPQTVFLNGEDVTSKIRENEISVIASQIAGIKEVRNFLHEIQRNLGKKGNFVVEGRDIGTVVFPDAKYKFFVNCTLEVKTKRRYNELISKGVEIDFETLKKQIKERDERDSINTYPATDAILIDNSEMSLDETVEEIVGRVI